VGVLVSCKGVAEGLLHADKSRLNARKKTTIDLDEDRITTILPEVEVF